MKAGDTASESCCLALGPYRGAASGCDLPYSGAYSTQCGVAHQNSERARPVGLWGRSVVMHMRRLLAAHMYTAHALGTSSETQTYRVAPAATQTAGCQRLRLHRGERRTHKGLLAGERGDVVLELFQFSQIPWWHDVRSRGHCLPDLDERWAQVCECLTQDGRVQVCEARSVSPDSPLPLCESPTCNGACSNFTIKNDGGEALPSRVKPQSAVC